MTVLLFIAISTYGNLVLTGVVEEKSSRVVEVLLARIPARNLLAGKVSASAACTTWPSRAPRRWKTHTPSRARSVADGPSV